MSIFPRDLPYNPNLHRELFADRTAVRLADRCARDLERFARRLNHGTIAALAAHHAPGVSITDALRALADEINTATMDLDRFQSSAELTMKAETTRLAPLMSKATRRVMAAVRRIEQIDAQMRSSQERAEGKRKQLLAAGVKEGPDLERIAGDTSEIDALKAERAALVDERATMEQFIRTRDESLLPADFVVNEPLRVDSTNPVPAPK